MIKKEKSASNFLKTYTNIFIIFLVGLAIWSIFYGALCYALEGIAGVLFGGCMMLVNGIIGTYYCRNKLRNAEQ